ncbi:hypothetical protein BLA15816_04267 [Burkholderia lata]|nr:hypothetical protein BLA15816_04267 [Burkholderia lata]
MRPSMLCASSFVSLSEQRSAASTSEPMKKQLKQLLQG